MSKKENITELYDGYFVAKDNPIIEFRGKLDLLMAVLLETTFYAKESSENNPQTAEIYSKLEELILFLRKIMYAESRQETFCVDELFGLSLDNIKEYTYNPSQNNLPNHFFVDSKMSLLMIKLNVARCMVRECEIVCLKAFSGKRDDLVRALNRFSSACYYLMLLVKKGQKN